MMDRFYAWATALIVESKNETGQTFVEYALVLSVIVVGVLLAATWGGLTGAIQGAITTSPTRSRNPYELRVGASAGPAEAPTTHRDSS